MEKNALTEGRFSVPIFFFIAAIIIFWGNAHISLWNQDEAAYAGFAQKMVSSGNWLIPDFVWSDAHRKTPFHFWMIALSYLLFGINEFAVRFSSSLATLGTFFLLFKWGKSIWGRRQMMIANYLLLSSLLFTAVAKVAVTDATLLFFQVAAALSILNFMSSKQKRWVYIFWTSIALGMLVKGPPIVIFGGTLGLLLLIFHPERKLVWQLKPWIFAPLSALPLLLWGYLAWQYDGGAFITWLIDWYILKRVGGSVFGQTGPPGYYVLIFCLSFLIWMPFVIRAIVGAFQKNKVGAHRSWALWLIAGWLIYEFISSKLPAYTIAAHPALAIGMAHYLAVNIEEKWRKFYGIFYLILGTGIVIGLIYLHTSESFIPDDLSLRPIFLTFVGLAVLLINLAFFIFRKKFTASLPQFLVSALLFNACIWILLVPKTQPFLDGHNAIINYMKSEEVPDSAVVYLSHHGGKPPSLPFYIGKEYPNLRFEVDTIKVYEAWYNTPAPSAFIVSKNQLSTMQRLTSKVKAREIKTRQIDRQNTNSYFVVLKK